MAWAHTRRSQRQREEKARIQAAGVKKCPKCGVEKPLDAYPAYRPHGYCKPCHSVYQGGRLRRHVLSTKYGITEEQYRKMLEQQGGVCAVCGRPPKKNRLSVEHDHKTGRVRCLACHACNRNKIGTNTVESARRVLALLESDFDGRTL